MKRDQPPLIVVHSQHERCGIAEYGQQLDAALVRQGASPIRLTYTASDRLLDEFRERATILVHYEPSLLPPGYEHTIRAARKKGATVVLCCHWFEPSLLTRYDGLADRFVVHRSYDVTHPRLAEIPLACPEYAPTESRPEMRSRLGLPADRTVVTTIGFLSGWKRVADTIDALLFSLPSDVFLQVLTPHPFCGTNATLETHIRAVLANHRAGPERVLFSTEFRPHMDLLDRAHASDLGFFYHCQHTGSVSAATKAFVSARTPFVTTYSSHDSDLRGGIVRVESFDLGIFAAEVARVAKDTAVRSALRAEMKREYYRLRMDVVARQYLDVFCGLQ